MVDVNGARTSIVGRRLAVRWVIIIAVGVAAFAVAMREGLGMAVTASAAAVAAMHQLLE